MAGVEKIKHRALIDHLKDEEDYYTQLISEFEIKHGNLPQSVLSDIFVTIVEPLIIEIAKDDLALVSRITRAFFIETIKLLGNNVLLHHLDLYKETWKLIQHIPSIFSQKPHDVLLALHDSLQAIKQVDISKTTIWIEEMNKVIFNCKSFSEFKNTGRLIAWIVGMAHLQEKANESFASLNDDLKTILRSNFNKQLSLEESLSKAWLSASDTPQTTQLCGFIGLHGGAFIKAPKLAIIDNVLFASDGESTCAIFSDICGTVVLHNVKMQAPIVYENEKQKRVQISPFHKLHKFSDMVSVLQIRDTIIYTRKSSFNIFMYRQQ